MTDTRALLEQALEALQMAADLRNIGNPEVGITAFSLVPKIRAELAKPAAPAWRDAPEQQSCKWAFDDDESNTWASGCGELWSFIDGGPAENRVKYCHGCGKPVVLGASHE